MRPSALRVFSSELHSCAHSKLLCIVDSSSPALSEDIASIISSGLDELTPGQPTLEQLNASFLQQGPTTAGKLLAAAQVAVLAKLPNAQSQAEEYIFQMLNDEARPTIPVSTRCLSSPILPLIRSDILTHYRILSISCARPPSNSSAPPPVYRKTNPSLPHRD